MAKSSDNTQNSKGMLLEAAKAIMEESGYAAVTSRRVAAKAGLKPQLVHYYFASMDDLIIELFQQLASEIIELQAEALATDYPLRELWKLLADRRKRILLEQFLIMSGYIPGLQSEMAKFGNLYRGEQIRFMESLIKANNIQGYPWTPEFLSVLFNSLARSIAIEPSYGLDLGIKGALDVVNHYIDTFDKSAPTLEATVRKLERENATLRAEIADLMKKEG